jgi:hypothetical protein
VYKFAAVLVAPALVFGVASERDPGLGRKLHAASMPIVDLIDRREEKPVLIIGNSRSFYNDMPTMLRFIADSDHSPERWAITLEAWNAARFEDHWESGKAPEELGRRWAEVVLQAESAASLTDESRASFETYGQKLVARAHAAGSPVALVVNWGWSAYRFTEPSLAQAKEAAERYADRLADDHRRLAAETGAQLIDVNTAWRELGRQPDGLELSSDGNHPTVYGSYVFALSIYRQISHGPLKSGLWRPTEISPEAALAAERAVERAASGGSI